MVIYFKICKTCISEKSVDDFSFRKISKDGYRNDCKLCASNKKKHFYKNNKEKKENLNKKAKEWRENNKDKLKVNTKNFNLRNPEYKKTYDIKNRDKKNKQYKKRMETDINFKLKENIRHLISNSIKKNGFNKNTKTEKILGHSIADFKKHIESNFLPWMTWDNYGNPKDGIIEPNKTWDLDHIIPLNTAKTSEDIIILNHYSNLRPLCSYNNRIIKRGKLNE